MIAVALAGGVAPGAWAQPATTPSPEWFFQGDPYSDGELKSFAAALLGVERVTDSYVPNYESARTPEDEARIRDAAVARAAQAIESAGISVDKYNEILVVAKINGNVADRIREHLKTLE
jgi:hypothetical protein